MSTVLEQLRGWPLVAWACACVIAGFVFTVGLLVGHRDGRLARDRAWGAWLHRIMRQSTVGVVYEALFPHCCFPPRCHSCRGKEELAECAYACPQCSEGGPPCTSS